MDAGPQTQVVYTGQVQHGFLERSLPRGRAQCRTGSTPRSTTPTTARARRSRFAALTILRPVKGAVRLGVRGYRDTWDIKSFTLELEAEKYILPWLRVRAGGRYYRQTAAVFWSDDYTGGEPDHGPRGQYWSGDREISPFSSLWSGVARLASWMAEEHRIIGLFEGFQAAVGFDILFYNYATSRWPDKAPQDTRAYIGSLSLTALF